MSSEQQKTTAVILSGGAGHRFNGADKGLQPYAGGTLIGHVLNVIEPQVDDVILCINRNHELYQSYGHRIVIDASVGYQGPIAGIVAALAIVGEDHDCARILVSSCDSPALPTDYVSTLIDALGETGVTLVNDGVRNQNLHCLIDRSAWTSLQEFYQSGGRAMHRWHKKVGAVEVNFSDQADCFSNINSPDQLT